MSTEKLPDGSVTSVISQPAAIEYLVNRPTGRKRVLWFQNEANHYFVSMLDALNAQGDCEYIGIFLCMPPNKSALLAMPQNSPFLFLGTAPPKQVGRAMLRPIREDARDIIEKSQFDLAIVGGYDSAFKRWVLKDCRSRNIPTAIWADSNIRGEFTGSARSFLRRLAKKIFLRGIVRSTDHIIPANSSGIAYWRYYGCQRDKITPATCLCDISAFASTRGGPQNTIGDLPGQLGIDRTKREIFTAARLVPVKALHLIIEAFGMLNLVEKGWVLVIAGGGPLEQDLRRQAGRLDGNGINFCGVLEHGLTKALAANSDLFVLPSTYEPHGIVISEAMGSGTPVIASDACGAAIDLVEPGKTGWLFRNGSVTDLVQVLKSATDAPEMLMAMRPACRRKFEVWYGEYSPLVAIPKIVAKLCGARREGGKSFPS